MEFRNLTPFDALCYSGVDLRGREHPVIAMKVGYRILADSRAAGAFRAEVIDSQPPTLCMADRYYGKENASSVAEESDLAPFKPRCDVIIAGRAHAPTGVASRQWEVGIRITGARPHDYPPDPPVPRPFSMHHRLTDEQVQQWERARIEVAKRRYASDQPQVLLDKRLTVTGPRILKRRLLGWWPGEIEPATQVPILWEHAFGGASQLINPPAHTDGEPDVLLNEVCFSNPLGCGWAEKHHLKIAHDDGRYVLTQMPAPQWLWPGQRFEEPVFARHPQGPLQAGDMAAAARDYGVSPAGLGIVGRAWAPRLAKAGTPDDAWLDSRWPGLPQDFDFGYWNGAPEDQQIPFPSPDLRVELWNLTSPRHTPSGHLSVQLPGHRAFVLARLRNGAMLPLPLLIDTLRIDTDAMRVTLTHRLSLPGDLDLRVLEARYEVDPRAPLLTRTDPAEVA